MEKLANGNELRGCRGGSVMRTPRDIAEGSAGSRSGRGTFEQLEMGYAPGVDGLPIAGNKRIHLLFS